MQKYFSRCEKERIKERKKGLSGDKLLFGKENEEKRKMKKIATDQKKATEKERMTKKISIDEKKERKERALQQPNPL